MKTLKKVVFEFRDLDTPALTELERIVEKHRKNEGGSMSILIEGASADVAKKALGRVRVNGSLRVEFLHSVDTDNFGKLIDDLRKIETSFGGITAM